MKLERRADGLFSVFEPLSKSGARVWASAPRFEHRAESLAVRIDLGLGFLRRLMHLA